MTSRAPSASRICRRRRNREAQVPVIAEEVGRERHQRDAEQEDQIDPEQRVVDVADEMELRVMADPEHPEHDEADEVDREACARAGADSRRARRLVSNQRCSGDLTSRTSSVIATAKMPSASASIRFFDRPRGSSSKRSDSVLMGVPPRLRLSPLRCPRGVIAPWDGPAALTTRCRAAPARGRTAR